MKRCLLIIVLSMIAICSYAQRHSISTNLVDWANYGTINAEYGYALTQHFSIVAGAKGNPWNFSNGDDQVYNKQAVVFAGARYWLWYVNSGFWFQAKAQFADYRITGTWRYALDKGQAIGAGLALGYTFMLTSHFNIEIGAGGWAGYLTKHELYECADCLRLRKDDSGPRGFADLDNLSFSLIYVF